MYKLLVLLAIMSASVSAMGQEMPPEYVPMTREEVLRQADALAEMVEPFYRKIMADERFDVSEISQAVQISQQVDLLARSSGVSSSLLGRVPSIREIEANIALCEAALAQQRAAEAQLAEE